VTFLAGSTCSRRRGNETAGYCVLVRALRH